MSGSPQLAEMLARNLISAQQRAAGDAFRGDGMLAISEIGRGSMRAGGARQADAGGGVDLVVVARQRFRQAQDMLGVMPSRLTTEVAVRDVSAAEAARELGLEARAGASVLRSSLDLLAVFYGLPGARPFQPVREELDPLSTR